MVQAIDDARRRNQAANRVPPHNLMAEQSLLGAMLLSRDAIAAAVETVSADDFYKPAHAHIFEAVTTLYSQGEPADPMTVADVLGRAGLLDGVGGLPALISLQNDTPTTANAARYARIVEEHALLRRLIGVAGEIAELGYSVPDDVTLTIDKAETLVFDIAERRTTDTLKPLRLLLEDSMDRLAELYSRGNSITGVPTGYVDLDEQLSGLQKSALIIVGARPAMGKCVAWDTRIMDPATGALATIQELFERRVAGDGRGTDVLSLGEDHRLARRQVSAWVDDGIKPVFRVTTRLGRQVRTTASHPFLTAEGWKPLRDLEVGARVAVPRQLDVFGSDALADAEVALLAYMIGDGNCTVTSPRFTTASAPILAEVTAWAAELGASVVSADTADASRAPINYRLVTRRGQANPVIDLLRRHGLWGSRSGDKRVPEAVFRLPERQLALFLNRLWATDGCAWTTDSGDGYGRIAYASVSRQLVADLQHLLLRFGINARIRFRSVKYKQTRRPAWELEIMAGPEIRTFCERIGIFSKEAACDRLMAQVASRRTGGYTRDTLPIQTWDQILQAKGMRTWRSVSAAAGRPASHNWHVGTRSPRRETVADLAEALGDEDLAARAQSDVYWDEIVAIVPDGEDQVYDLTVPGDHNFVADDILVHNTAFALGMASHAAMEAGIPTLVFSLEMSHAELTQRLLVSEARVDANRIRNGKLAESDWSKISKAVGRLGEAPLYIDDNPNLTVMDLRAKARRMKSREGGLGLIIVDYLQLMSGRSSAENRQVEVSEISRGLKILARELEVPVVALSQLSRQLESRADKRPMLADLRESGCMPAGTRLLRADNGQEVTLGELVLTQECPLVWSLDETTWKLVPRRVLKVFPSGIKPVFRLRLASGREVEATGNHPFRTIDGWRRLDELAPGVAVAVPRQLSAPVSPGAPAWTDDELVLLAHLLGDGSIGPNGVKYATADEANKRVVEETARRLFGIEVAGEMTGRTWQLWLPSPYRLTHGRFHPVRNWLEPHGLWGSRSHNKFIPESVFGLGARELALFLHHLWATDGSITLGRNGRGPVVRAYYASTSRRLADGVRRALLRLGVQSRISEARKEGYRPGWHVTISGTTELTRFLTVVGCHGERGERIPACLEVLRTQVPNPNVDLVPFGVSSLVKDALTRAGVSHRELAARMGEQYCGSYLLGSADRPRRFSRRRLEAMAEITADAELEALATSEVAWDEVVEITATGHQPTFDATIEDTHNFIADGIIAHNSLEQDADVVMFLYRDEVYDPESAERGTAEVIVAKHRNGPVGKTSLAFLDHHTRFENMAKI